MRREVSGVGSFQVSACIQLGLFGFGKGMGVQNTVCFGDNSCNVAAGLPDSVLHSDKIRSGRGDVCQRLERVAGKGDAGCFEQFRPP